jgi:hypothetical protein
MGDKLGERVLTLPIDGVREFIEKRIEGDARAWVRLLVALTEALEEEFGKEEGYRMARRAYDKMAFGGAPTSSEPDEDRSLQAFCARLEVGCIGTHEWERREDTPDRVVYRFTRCAWAELFRKVGRPDIGHWFCDGDEPAARAFNPRIGFRRTQVLMDGDPCCDHVFFIERE